MVRRQPGRLARGSPIYNVSVLAPSTGTLPVYAGIRICRRLERPFSSPEKMLDDLHNQPSVQLARKSMSSCGEPYFIEGENFGPFSGQMLVPDENGRRINRIMMEKIDGAWQGASTLSSGLANCGRAAFALQWIPPASLSTTDPPPADGKNRRRCSKNLLQRPAPFHVQNCKLTTRGFQLWFILPIQEPENSHRKSR